MTSTVYRGTRLSEAVQMLSHECPKKYLYRTTDINEALPYAETSKWMDKGQKGSIVEAQVTLTPENSYEMDYSTWKSHYSNKKSLKKDKVNFYRAGNFNVLITSPNQFDQMKQMKIANII